MEKIYIVQEGIWSPRDEDYVWRYVVQFGQDHGSAVKFARTYSAARVLRVEVVHEHCQP